MAVIHGGPGAPGYMAPVARELSTHVGVIEPLQSADSLEGQIEELYNQLQKHAELPAVLIGSSWGAVLSLFVASRFPDDIRKLILIGSAVFDTENSQRVLEYRIARLSDNERDRYHELQQLLTDEKTEDRDELMAELGQLMDSTDMYDPITTDLETLAVQFDVFSNVWPQYEELRDRPGYLESEFSKITCPVVVIHGEYDPHPIEGIRPYLGKWLKDISFHILPDCGHYPWLERKARDRFYEIVGREL